MAQGEARTSSRTVVATKECSGSWGTRAIREGSGRDTAPAPGSAPVRQAPAAGLGNVYLQVGAFSQPANAQSLVSRINTQLGTAGAPPALMEQSNNLYRVKIGPYPDRQSALDAVQLVSERIGILPSIAAQ